jgi:hypothetical protein
MKLFLLLCISLTGLFFFSPSAFSQFASTPFAQVDILRVAPDHSAAFVPLALPLGNGGKEPKVEILSRKGEWEEVRLHYRFKFNGSTDPNVCAMSLFEEAFTGFRKITENK